MEIIRERPKARDVIYFDGEPRLRVTGELSLEAVYNYCRDKPTELGKLILSDAQISELAKFDYLTIGVDVYICLG
jgi:hypothetical protein